MRFNFWSRTLHNIGFNERNNAFFFVFVPTFINPLWINTCVCISTNARHGRILIWMIWWFEVKSNHDLIWFEVIFQDAWFDLRWILKVSDLIWFEVVWKYRWFDLNDLIWVVSIAVARPWSAFQLRSHELPASPRMGRLHVTMARAGHEQVTEL